MEIKNTTTIQFASLDAYMTELGFKRSCFGSRYEFKYPISTGTKTIRFNTAVKLYNSVWKYDTATKMYYPVKEGFVNSHFAPNTDSPFSLSPYEYEKSQSRKIVSRVSLQQTKNGVLKVQKNLVEFMAPFYFEQFLGD